MSKIYCFYKAFHGGDAVHAFPGAVGGDKKKCAQHEANVNSRVVGRICKHKPNTCKIQYEQNIVEVCS